MVAIGLSLTIAGSAGATRDTGRAQAHGHITFLSHSIVSNTHAKSFSTSTAGNTTFGIITSPTDGASFTYTIAFTDDNADPVFVPVIINWGDTTLSLGAITPLGGINYSLSGTHTYANEGSYGVSLTITDISTTPPTTAPYNATIPVSEGDLTVTNTALNLTEGVATTGPV